MTAAAKIANAFEWPGQPPKIVHSLGDLQSHLTHGSVGPPESSVQNGMSIGSAVFCTAHHRVSHYFTMGGYVFSFALGDRVSHLTHSTYGIPESSTQTAYRSVHPFSHGPKCCIIQCIVSGEETPPQKKNCPFLLGFRHPAGGGPSHRHLLLAKK